jgi:hypothetical protein
LNSFRPDFNLPAPFEVQQQYRWAERNQGDGDSDADTRARQNTAAVVLRQRFPMALAGA